MVWNPTKAFITYIKICLLQVKINWLCSVLEGRKCTHACFFKMHVIQRPNRKNMLNPMGRAIKIISSLSLEVGKRKNTDVYNFFMYPLKRANFQHPSHLISTILKTSVKTSQNYSKYCVVLIVQCVKRWIQEVTVTEPEKQLLMRLLRISQEQIQCILKFPLFNRITQ